MPQFLFLKEGESPEGDQISFELTRWLSIRINFHVCQFDITRHSSFGWDKKATELPGKQNWKRIALKWVFLCGDNLDGRGFDFWVNLHTPRVYQTLLCRTYHLGTTIRSVLSIWLALALDLISLINVNQLFFFIFFFLKYLCYSIQRSENAKQLSR